MQLREVAVSIAAGIAILALAFPFPVLFNVVEAATTFWYLGATTLVAALVVGWSSRAPEIARLLGVIGILWTTLVVAPILLLAIMISIGGWGY